MSFFVLFIMGTFVAAFLLRGKEPGARAAAITLIILAVAFGYFFLNRI